MAGWLRRLYDVERHSRRHLGRVTYSCLQRHPRKAAAEVAAYQEELKYQSLATTFTFIPEKLSAGLIQRALFLQSASQRGRRLAVSTGNILVRNLFSVSTHRPIINNAAFKTPSASMKAFVSIKLT